MQNTDAAKASSDLPDGLFVPVADDTSARLRFVPLPPPTAAEVEDPVGYAQAWPERQVD